VKNKIAAVLVLYNKSLASSETFQTLLKGATIPLLVYDNSPEAQPITSNGLVSYYYNASNAGVSGAYNYAMKWARENTFSHLLLLDSDSLFPEKAWEEYKAAVSQYPANVILPAMLSGGHKISPFYFKWGKSWYGDDIAVGELSSNKVIGINSGTILPIAIMEELGGFNEELPLDWSDVEFMRRLRKENKHFVHIPLEVGHALSEHAEKDLNRAKFRYRLYLKGLKLVARNLSERLLMLFWAKMKALKLCIKYKTLWFLMHYTRKFYA
jgi:GT2 family glycosyltransferase